MKSTSYYSFIDRRPNGLNNCSVASDSAPLIVNCAGSFFSRSDFTTDNQSGRLDYYLMHIVSGKLRARMPNGDITVRAGESLIFPPLYKYRYSYEADGEELNYLWVHFTGSAASFYLEELGFSPLPTVVRPLSESSVSLYFSSMQDGFSRDDEARPTSLAASFLQMLVELSRSTKEKRKRNALMRSLGYINRAYTDTIQIDELAAMENLSSSRYHVLFKEITGVAPSEYIIGLRMRDACELLRSTNMTVKQIGASVGYENQHYFSKLFKLKIGVPPIDYRKGARQIKN